MVRFSSIGMLVLSVFVLCGCGDSALKDDPLFERVDDVYQAAAAGDVEAVRFYVSQYSWDPIIADFNGVLPLCYGAKSGNVDVIAILVQAGCDVNMADMNGKTPLQYAKDSGNEDAVQYLIQLGAKE